MIKITIDGEEVYSAKDFTIKEEMLNTPSVILNNVYPISWEQDRDYVSRFYHPNDYSKCLIMNNTHIPEEPGITVTSTSINADVDTSKKYEYALMGDTKQGLPSGYTQVDYIESRGTQYIDTGYKPNPNMKVEADMQFTSVIGQQRVFGNQNTETNGLCVAIYMNGANPSKFAWACQNGTGNWTATTVNSDTNRHYFMMDIPNNKVMIDTTTANITQTHTNNSNMSLLIGTNRNSGVVTTLKAKAKIYSFKIWESNNLVRNFVPCFNSNNVVGLYDTVNDVFYENVGTGTFTYGNIAPTPDTPVAIDTVTGGQTIKVTGKNLCPVSSSNFVSTTTWASLTGANANTYTNGTKITLDRGTYTITFSERENINAIQVNGISPMLYGNGTFTISDKTDIYIRVRVQNISNPVILKTQLEKGSTATEFEEYKSQTYEINLGNIELCKIGDYQDFIKKGTGKNLFNPSYEVETQYNTQGTVIQQNRYILSDGVISIDKSNNNYGASYFNKIYLESGTYTWSMNVSQSGNTTSNARTRIHDFDSGTDILNENTVITSRRVEKTFTIDTPMYVYLMIVPSQNTDGTLLLSNIQLEKNNQATKFEPYGYKDKWYMYKAIGKLVLDGSENWSLFATLNNVCRYVSSAILNAVQTQVYSDRFMWYSTQNKNTDFNREDNEAIYIRDDLTHIGIKIDKNIANSKNSFETWLSNNPVTVYYVLQNPQITEITNTELINQLESIELYNGINNIMVSGNLPSPIQLHYNYVTEEDISDLLFCGVVKNSGYISLNPRHPHYQTLQILDFKTFLSEGETLDFVIANKTIEEAIEQVISTIAPYGFIKGNIQLLNSSDVIGAYSTKDKTAYDVFNYIADITQSRWTTRLIDENTVAIDFYDPTLLPQGSPIDYTQNYFEQNLIDDISYSYGSNDYRNKQIMTSSEVYGSILQSQTIVANGYQTQFATELKIGKISSITINGNQMTFATNQEKELGYTADFYYTPGNNFFESADLRSTGQIIIISYLAIVEGRQIITNALEIDRVATSTGRKGVVARYEDRNDATTSTELQLIGQSYIKYKGVPEIKLNVTTRKNLWNIGDRVTFNAPITELATEYMVKKKEIQRVFANPSSEEVIFYKFELSSSFNMEQAINYFDNQRAKAKGNIGEGEYITRNVDIENISNVIFYDGTCEEITLVGDNTLNSVLNSPFIN